MNLRLLHRITYKVLRPLVILYLRLFFGYKAPRQKAAEGPYIVMSNHTSNWDMMLIACSFSKQMYFVASEQLFRSRFFSKLMKVFFAPIMRIKAQTDTRTVRDIMRAVKRGDNICIFPEGSNTWNGETAEIVSGTAKLIKSSGAALVTYNLVGTYLCCPRWARSRRHGPVNGKIVRSYSKEELSAMSVPEIQEALNRDLYVNVYDLPAERYPGKRLAESLETALYLCPECGAIATMKSEGDRFYCTECGLDLIYNEYGRFETKSGDAAPFVSVLEWFRWQSSRVMERADDFRALSENVPITEDEEQLVYEFAPGKSTKLVGKGRLRLYNNRLVLDKNELGGSIVIHFHEITDMAASRQSIFSVAVTDRPYYEFKTLRPRSAVKYMLLTKSLARVRVML